jgi:SAM-dependent methyltransferase
VLSVSSGESIRRFGQVFDDVAAAYDEVRPSYPASLVDTAMERGALIAGSRILEVGSGTGKLTELLAARGLDVDAVEPGPNMIEAARKRVGATGRVRFHLGRFEDVRLPEDARDPQRPKRAFARCCGSMLPTSENFSRRPEIWRRSSPEWRSDAPTPRRSGTG